MRAEDVPVVDAQSSSRTNESHDANADSISSKSLRISSGSRAGAHSHMQGFTPVALGEAYRPLQSDMLGPGLGQADRQSQQSQQNACDVEFAESVDVNASIHGQWTIENAKSKLHQFLQENRIAADYRYTSIGPDHNK